MYSLIIVDDDEIIREGLEKNINWVENGFTVLGTASNGVEGLEMTRVFRPQLVISDIKMPFMDGIEMTKIIMEEFPLTKVIILTGYDEFEYARKAINCKVCDYILKYSYKDEILEAAKKACKQLASENVSMQLAEKGIEFLHRDLYIRILSGVTSVEDALAESVRLNLPIQGKFFSVAVLCHENRNMDNIFFNPDSAKSYWHVEDAIKSVVLKHEGNISFSIPDGLFVIISSFQIRNSESALAVHEILEEINTKISEKTGISLYAGMGEIYEGVGNISKSFGEAIFSLLKGLDGKHGKITHIKDFQKGIGEKHSLMDQIMDYINTNCFREDLSLEDISRKVFISGSYISILFKRYKKMNLSEYLVKVRIEKAIQLLTTTEMKVMEVSEAVGYKNPQYFSVLFKKMTGKSPGDIKSRN